MSFNATIFFITDDHFVIMD